MATGLLIQSATYGSGNNTVDVKNEVTSQIYDGKIAVVVSPAALGVTDPAPGQIKTLTVSYSINGGSKNTVSVNDDETLNIDAPPARIASGLKIVKAQYGYDGNFTDVTSAVRTYVDNGSINMKVSPTTVGIPDPNPNKQKVLKVDLKINDEPSSQTIEDGKYFQLSAPSVNTIARSNPGASAFEFVWLFVSRIFTTVFLTFWIASSRVAYNAGGILYLVPTVCTFGWFPVLVLPFWSFAYHLIFG
uniref:Uncharacterized protein n=1 Tax=viral metagenome TaxID=1070528 RepID=A0A6C0CHZ1_9ZZZZ